MATSQLSQVIERLRRLVLLRDAGGLPDEKLLESFISRKEEAAFEAIVRRHGAMVMGVCRRILRSYHDAEDAFQATFLVLARKAASINVRQSLANWLYCVAYKTALKAKAANAHRCVREREGAEMPKPEAMPPEHWLDLQGFVDQELSRLPEKYRLPIVLCDLQGKTRKEAAIQLGCPEGTVAGRLARARALLAKRLTQRGVALSGAVLAGQESLGITSACVPSSLITATSHAAMLYATGQTVAGIVSSKVAALAAGVLQTLLVTKLKTITFVALGLSLVALGAGGVLTRSTTVAQIEPAKTVEITHKPDQGQGAPKAIPSRKITGVANDAGQKPAENAAAIQPRTDEKETLLEGVIARLGEVRFKNFGRPYCIDFAPDSKSLAIGSWDGAITCWNLDRLALRFQSEGHSGPVHALAFSPDSKTLASVGDEVRLWQSADGKPTTTIPHNFSPPGWHATNLYFSPNGTFLVVAGPQQMYQPGHFSASHLDVVRLTTKNLHYGTGGGDEGLGRGTAFFDDVTLAFLGYVYRDGRHFPKIAILDLQTRKIKKEIDVDFIKPREASVMSSTGKWFVAYGNDLKLHVMNVPSQVVSQRESLFLFDFVISPDERFLAGFDGRGIAIVELTSGLVRRRFPNPERNKACLAVSPDGRFLACGDVDRSVFLWDLTGRRENGTLSPVALSAAELDRLWFELDSSDGALVHQAVWALVAGAADSVPFLQGKSIMPPVNAEHVARFVRELEDDNFKVRTAAESELEKLGYQAEPALRMQLAKSPALEGRRRIEKLLNLIDQEWNRSRMLRVIEVLEHCGTSESRQVLQKLTQIEGEGRRAEEAKAAMRRLDRAAEK